MERGKSREGCNLNSFKQEDHLVKRAATYITMSCCFLKGGKKQKAEATAISLTKKLQDKLNNAPEKNPGAANGSPPYEEINVAKNEYAVEMERVKEFWEK